MGKVAATFFLNNEGKLLFYLRDNNKPIPYPGFWALLGGQIEKGETPLQALKREIKEEIGYDIKGPLFIGTFDDAVGNIVYAYRAKINKKINEMILTEGQKLEYFSLEEALTLKLPIALKNFLVDNKNEILTD